MANVCQTCGNRGFEEAIVYCDSCKIEVIHRYCLGVTPVPFTEEITWLCEDCDSDRIDIITINDSKIDYDGSEAGKVQNILEMEKKTKSSNEILPVLAVEDHVEPVKISFSLVKETPNEYTRRIYFIDISDSDSDCDWTDVGKTAKREKKENNRNLASPCSAVEDHVEPVKMPSSRVKETMKESKRRKRFIHFSDSDSDCDGTDVGKTAKREKKKKNSNHASQGSAVEDHVGPFKVPSSRVKETMESKRRRRFLHISESDSDCDGTDCDGSDVNKTAKKEKKERSSNHAPPVLAVEELVEPVKVPSARVKETMKESKSRENTECGKPNGLTCLVRNEASVSKAKTSSFNSSRKEVDQTAKLKHILKKEKKEKSSNHTSPVLASKDNVKPVKLYSSTVKETMKESKSQENSERGKPHGVTCLARNKTSFSKNKKSVVSYHIEVDPTAKLKSILKKQSNNHTSPVLAVTDHVEPLKMSSLLVKETMKESESKRCESSDFGKPHELTRLTINEESVSKAKMLSSNSSSKEVDQTAKLKYILKQRRRY